MMTIFVLYCILYPFTNWYQLVSAYVFVIFCPPTRVTDSGVESMSQNNNNNKTLVCLRWNVNQSECILAVQSPDDCHITSIYIQKQEGRNPKSPVRRLFYDESSCNCLLIGYERTNGTSSSLLLRWRCYVACWVCRIYRSRLCPDCATVFWPSLLTSATARQQHSSRTSCYRRYFTEYAPKLDVFKAAWHRQDHGLYLMNGHDILFLYV